MKTPPSLTLSPPLSKGERGAIILPQMKIDRYGDNGVSLNGNSAPSPSLIRSALLFVDKIDFPDTNVIRSGALGGAGLSGLDIGGSTELQWGSFDGGYDEMSVYGWLAYKALDKREPGRWSIWQEPDQSIIPETELSSDLAFRLDFNCRLPVPHSDLPYDDLLQFKEKHKDELGAFNAYMLRMMMKISECGDPREATAEIEEFDLSLADYIKKTKESNRVSRRLNLTPEMDWAAAIKASGGAGLLSAVSGLSLPATAAAIGTGLLAGLSVKSTAGLKKGDTSPLRYIAHVEREFGA